MSYELNFIKKYKNDHDLRVKINILWRKYGTKANNCTGI